ncbi:uncharacterized protein [Diadema setosum]|uniref:uncharacterized protein n=1 Tax=Diadema setosum TaxID=31175 RepID=UPI003B3A9C85
MGVQCYSCSVVDGVGDPGCADPFNSEGIRTEYCTNGCKKDTDTKNGREIGVVRSCWDRSAPCSDECQSFDGNTECVYCCAGNLCNGGGALSASFFAIPIAAIVAASLQSAI